MQLLPSTFIFLAALRAAANPITITSVLTVIPVPMTVVHYPNTTYTLKAMGTGNSAGRYGNFTLQRTLPYSTTYKARTITTTIATPSSLITSSPETTFIGSTSLASATPSASATSVPESCTPNGILCNNDATYSLCAPSTSGSPQFVNMGTLPDGSVCTDGAVAGVSCTPMGKLYCALNGMQFFECNQGGILDMGSLKPGTECEDGQIVASN